MPLRHVAQALIAIWQALRSIQQGISTIMGKFDELETANANEAAAVSTALAAILALQSEHTTDLAKLAAIQPPEDDTGELATLTASMQSRAKTITDALSTLQSQVTAPAADTISGAGSDTVTGAAVTDTVVGATS